MVEIPLRHGGVALVDDDDYPKVADYSWRLCRARWTCIYAIRSATYPQRGTVAMHRQILGLGRGEMCDHVDGNGLNNTRTNLRPCTPRQNMQNRRLRTGASSGYKGALLASSRPRPRPWRSRIKVEGKNKHLGYFATAIEAARAYDAAAIRYFGKFARLNFPMLSPAS